MSPLDPATTRIEASTVPMHGAAHTANAPPSSTPEPLCRARCSSPGATALSGIGIRPMKASPITTSAKPAICVWLDLGTTLAIEAAAAPSATKTSVKPMMNGMLAITTRLPAPRSPSRSTSTEETAERYPGTSGSTQGVMTEISPARNATGSFSTIEAGELLVEAPLDLGVERRAGGRRREPAAVAAPRPVPRGAREDHRTHGDAEEREQPGQQVEPVLLGDAEDRLAHVVGRADEAVDDLAARLAGRDAAADLGLHLLRDGRVRHVERRVAGRAHEHRLELALRRVLLAREGGCGEREDDEHGRGGREPHAFELQSAAAWRFALRMPLFRSACDAGPTMCGATTQPCFVTKNVSGYPVTPKRPTSGPPSLTIGYSMSKRLMNLSAGPRRSCTSMPTKTTPLSRQFRAESASVRASCVQGAQYDCQKLMTVTFPRSEASVMLPLVSTRGRVKSGAATILFWSTS